MHRRSAGTALAMVKVAQFLKLAAILPAYIVMYEQL